MQIILSKNSMISVLVCSLVGAIICILPVVVMAQPNVVVLLVDDGGFMDFGGFGGEAKTPNIDQLADQGVRFSNYHTSPLCAPSRAMLLTGLDNHNTGVGTIPEVLTEEQKGSSQYALRLQPGVRTIAGRLKEQGYQTFMTGKWHLGRGEGDLPDSHGFDRSFALDASGADNWEQKTFIPFYDEAPWYEDGVPVDLPDNFYSSKFIVDKMSEYVADRDTAQPFFAYLAFQAIHIPVQAPREFTERYQGVYSDGWEATRQRRIERATELGLISKDTAPPEMHPSLRAWASLTEEEKKHYEGNMMVNAGMLEAMDHHIGRFMTYLEHLGELENTVFVITSDNGPEFGDPTGERLFGLWMSQNGYHTDPERLGEKGYMGAIGAEWASAAAVPGSLFKMYASEGGTRVPLIISGAGIAASSGFNSALSFVTDIAPTIAELAGHDALGSMDGRSLVPVLTGLTDEIYGDDEAVGMEVAGNAALFKGRYKLTRNTKPHGDAEWRLHDLRIDPAELQDLSAQLPLLRNEMLADYEAFAAQVGVIELPKDFNIQAQVGLNTLRQFLLRNLMEIIFAATLVVLLILLLGFGCFQYLKRRVST